MNYIVLYIGDRELMRCENVLRSSYSDYFCYFKRIDKASVILSYSFWIHDLIGGWGVAVTSCQVCVVVVSGE